MSSYIELYPLGFLQSTFRATNESQLPRQVAELQSKIQSKTEELQLRERLSQLTNEMRKDQSDTAAAAKMASAAMKPTGGN